MLSSGGSKKTTISFIIKEIYAEGIPKFFSGIGPRVGWISIGGSIFLGTFEAIKTLLV
jgi:solute carrier family 25 S-adenosylmethionine transporter 26